MPRLVEIVLLFLLAWVLARLIWLIAFGASAADFQDGSAGGGADAGRPAYIADLDRLRGADLFADRRQTVAVSPAAVRELPETRLNLVLRGVRRGATIDAGGAIVQTPDSRQGFFSVGDEIVEGVTLEEVHVDHVVINRRGVAETLFLRDEAARRERSEASRASGPSGILPRSVSRQTLAGNIPLEPVMEGDRLHGYRFSEGADYAMLAALGLRSGDVVTAINGRALADVDDLNGFFESLENGGQLTLSVSRGGLPLTLQVDLP